ncbi:VIT1/CCC1 transporter family protein [Pseudomonas koreensis]|uniref:VIT1/CCC1 transporter family protein n=1 Tax=Pseudomonas koreensis TaxID=198620 RepID=UPI0021C7B93E|nr:VIT1/CCC1 transporter family protein [Pseudomonas koreensis]MCU0074636.1 VIT1/CCC1 transporter family protein [Pseudomonas koreensis]
MHNPEESRRARVLDPVERGTEVIFGLLMAMTFTGTISVATAGQEDERTMMFAALGCNLAWGLADAVMYLLRTLVERVRKRTLLANVRDEADAVAGQALIADALPPRLLAAAGPEELESLRRRLIKHSTTSVKPILGWDDFKGAVGVFLLVVLSTFPLVVPFLLLEQTSLAVRLSNLIGLAVLFIAGWLFARYAGVNPWFGAFAMAVTGAVLIAAIIALGG